MRSLRVAALLLAVAVLAAGCGDANEPAETSTGPAATAPGGSGPGASAPGEAPAGTSLDGRRFDAVTLAGRRPVARSGAGIAFERGEIAVATGCNGMGGTYEVADGRLRTGDLLQTQMACEPPLMRQEEAFRALLESTPRVTLAGETLTLTAADGSESVFKESDRPRGPRPIAGTSWVLETISDSGPDGTASNVPAGVKPPTLLIRGDGTVALFAGCNRGGGRAVVRDDGFVDFGPIALTRMACEQAASQVEATVTAILDGRVAAAFTGEGDLVLSKDGRSLTFKPGG